MLKLIGFTRFSVVTNRTLANFASTRSLGLKEAQSLIWSEERMTFRFRLLEAFCIPTYKMLEEISPNSFSVFLICKSMPEVYKTRLRASLRDTRRARIVELDNDQSPSEAGRTAAKEVAGESRVFSYRLDEDDAIGTNFIDSVNRYSERALDGEVLSFDNGYYVFDSESGRPHFDNKRYPLIAIGLGVFSSPPKIISPFCLGNHRKIGEKYKVHHVAEKSWIRSIHETSDSGTGKRLKKRNETGVPYSEIQSIFPQISIDRICRTLKS